MPRELVITNGDATAQMLGKIGLGEHILAWQDVLYEGPVPLTTTLDELSRIRASYLAARYPLPGRDVLAELRARDACLRRHADFDLVTLWFEHDLHDTLQLLQVLDFFATADRPHASLRIVHADSHLAELTTQSLRALAASVRPVGRARLNGAQEAWARWREPDPRLWSALRNRTRLSMKHLWNAVVDSLDHIPLAGRGVTAMEAWVLGSIAEMQSTPDQLFRAYAHWCDRAGGRYMGDLGFFAVLDGLAAGPSPLIAGLEQRPFRAASQTREAWLQSIPALTLLGREVLAGKADWTDHVEIDRWFGGRHISLAAPWRYDAKANRIVLGR